MKRSLTLKRIAEFATCLKNEEKSENTVKKYVRDIKAFALYVGDVEITKETVISYKNKLFADKYAVRSINSMLASLNSFFSYFGWVDLKVRSVKLQRQMYCPEDKELTKSEYMRLVSTAQKLGNQRLNLLI